MELIISVSTDCVDIGNSKPIILIVGSKCNAVVWRIFLAAVSSLLVSTNLDDLRRRRLLKAAATSKNPEKIHRSRDRRSPAGQDWQTGRQTVYKRNLRTHLHSSAVQYLETYESSLLITLTLLSSYSCSRHQPFAIQPIHSATRFDHKTTMAKQSYEKIAEGQQQQQQLQQPQQPRQPYPQQQQQQQYCQEEVEEGGVLPTAVGAESGLLLTINSRPTRSKRWIATAAGTVMACAFVAAVAAFPRPSLQAAADRQGSDSESVGEIINLFNYVPCCCS